MTLILARLSRHYVVHASDRLVTRAGSPFDVASNKSILWLTGDAVIALAYTGTAFLEGIPADQWIVEKITGESFPRDRKPMMLRTGPLPRRLRSGPGVQLLRDELTAAFTRRRMRHDARRMYFEVLGAGWQWGRRKRPRPVMVTIEKPEGETECRIGYAPRHLGRISLLAATPPGNVGHLDPPALLRDFSAAPSVGEVESLCARAIAEVAARSPYVGPDCMSIFMPPPQVGHVRVRYMGRPGALGVGPADGTGEMRRLIAAYSPWIVGPGLIQAPALSTGSSTLFTGGFEITLEMPSRPGSGILFAATSIPRPREPG